ncbi:MAG: winged helix-turn-helix transcriptional regulator [Thermocrispum sp.]
MDKRQHCPVARAMDVLGDPWTLLLLRELLEGEFSLHTLQERLRDLPAPALNARVRKLEHHGLLAATSGESADQRYRLTPRGVDARDVIDAFGVWGQRWLPAPNLGDLDPRSLLEDICRDADRSLLPVAPTTIQVDFLDAPHPARWWLTLSRAVAAASDTSPPREARVFVRTTRPTLAQVWLGDTSWQDATISGALASAGDSEIIGWLPTWIGTSRFAAVSKRGAALPTDQTRSWRGRHG